LSEDLLDIIEKANQLFGEGFKKRDAALATSMYTDDTMLLPPNMEVIRGKENAEAFWGTSIEMGVIMEEHKIMEIIREGYTATEWGTYVVSFHPEGQEPVEEKGKYVVVWKRTTDGSWKKHWDIWNSSMPLPE
jgi:ketosteroid isomerase-like protein